MRSVRAVTDHGLTIHKKRLENRRAHYMQNTQTSESVEKQTQPMAPCSEMGYGKFTFTLRELLADTSTPPGHIVEGGILVPGGITLIHGKPKTRKSFLAIQLGMHLAGGTPWLGFKIPQPKRVLYVQAELTYHAMRSRVYQMSARLMEGKNTSNLMVTERFQKRIDNPDEYNSIKKMIEGVNVDVIIIDPLVYFHGSSENSNDEMGKVMSSFRSLVDETGTSLVLVHHDGKSFELSGGDASRGASAIFGAVDTDVHIGTESSKGPYHTHQELSFSMRHSRTPDPRKIYFDDNSLTFCENHFTTDEAKLLQIVLDARYSDRQTLAKKVEEVLGCKKSKAYSLIKESIESQTIFVNDAGLITIPDSEF
jgi:hypothetical protein